MRSPSVLLLLDAKVVALSTLVLPLSWGTPPSSQVFPGPHPWQSLKSLIQSSSRTPRFPLTRSPSVLLLLDTKMVALSTLVLPLSWGTPPSSQVFPQDLVIGGPHPHSTTTPTVQILHHRSGLGLQLIPTVFLLMLVLVVFRRKITMPAVMQKSRK